MNQHEGHDLVYSEKVIRSWSFELDGNTIFVQDNTEQNDGIDESYWCETCHKHISLSELGVESKNITMIWV